MNATIIGIVGFIATVTVGLLGPVVQAHVTTKKERAASVDHYRIAAYADTTAYVYARLAFLRWLTHPETEQEIYGSPPSPKEDRFTVGARLHLVAPDQVVVMWRHYLEAEEVLAWHFVEQWDPTPSGRVVISDTNQQLVAVQQALNAMAGHLRADLNIKRRAASPK